MFIAFAVRNLVLIRRIDYAAPIVVIQKQLAELRAWHIRAAAWYGLTGSVIWLPVMIVMLHAWGADRWIDKSHKMLWLISSAIACLALNYGLVRLAAGARKVRPVATSQLDRSHSESCANNAGRDRKIRTRAELILACGWVDRRFLAALFQIRFRFAKMFRQAAENAGWQRALPRKSRYGGDYL